MELKILIDKLTDETRQYLKESASLAIRYTHYEVNIEHLLLVLLEKANLLSHEFFETLSLDKKEWVKCTQLTFNQFEKGNDQHPVFSEGIAQWLEAAWMDMNRKNRKQINARELFICLLLTPALYQYLSTEMILLFTHNNAEDIYRLVEQISEPMSDSSMTEYAALNQYTHHLTEAARQQRLDPILGRDKEIRQLIDILLRRKQNNPILTGDAGVGKTAVVEGLAHAIVQQKVPAVLQETEIFSLDLGLLQAGASVKGEFENRLQQLIEEIKHYPKQIVLFIDEAHMLIGAGGQSGQNDAANLLKPVLARGELRTIAATTWAEYKKYFEKDAALVRRFQVVKVDEPTIDDTIVMLRGIIAILEQHHQVTITDAAIIAAAKLSHQYIIEKQLPDKAISLLDTACARVRISQVNEPVEITDIRAALAALSLEQQQLQKETGHKERIQTIREKQQQLTERLTLALTCFQQQQHCVEQIIHARQQQQPIDGLQNKLAQMHQQRTYVFDCVDERGIADIIADWTGIPVKNVTEKEEEKLTGLEKRLTAHVIGQDYAVKQLVQQIRIAKAKLTDPVKPLGVFLLAGPTGVGKTETALALATELYGGEHNLITINMSEYQEAHSVAGLKGSPPGYVGYGQGGVLTEAVRRRPYSILLLDEIEKAHADVWELFFQVFDRGIMEDAEGQIINFRNTLILLTTNVAAEFIEQMSHDSLVKYDNISVENMQEIKQAIYPVLKKTFPDAFLGRLKIIPYLPLSRNIMNSIFSKKMSAIKQRCRDFLKVDVEYDESLFDPIFDKMIFEGGAREIDALINDEILTRLGDVLLKDHDIKSIAIKNQ